ncbi:hypothetical protein [Companilactobacillus jidongensis]|uniref:hypothetical protein n=1 Tax=Companilactobacillus jidongensis TaxID=2486006 RepID=UPI000F7A1208|nr:hypothetical protein [Companilactobacillus jidongensis]
MNKQLKVEILGSKLMEAVNNGNISINNNTLSCDALCMCLSAISKATNGSDQSISGFESMNDAMDPNNKISAIKELAAAGFVKTNIYELELA